MRSDNSLFPDNVEWQLDRDQPATAITSVRMSRRRHLRKDSDPIPASTTRPARGKEYYPAGTHLPRSDGPSGRQPGGHRRVVADGTTENVIAALSQRPSLGN